MSAFDTEMFIVTIEKHECSWKLNSKEYSDRYAKVRAWSNVGETMFDGWHELNDAEQKLRS